MARIPKPWPEKPPPGPFQRDFWKSPLRGPWLTSFLGSALLPLILICALTGFLSHVAYYPELGDNSVTGSGGVGFDLYFFNWPSSPAWLYAFTQGLHIISGVAAIPILLAKLWSAMPKFFEWPPVRSPAHLLDRLSLALLVGGSLFVFFTGILNIQLWYPFGFSFVPAHYYGAFIFLAALGLHLVGKIPVARRAFREKGVLKPLREDLDHTAPEAPEEGTSAPFAPKAPTISRRARLGTVGAGSLGLALMAVGQVAGGPFRKLAILSPRGRGFGSGANEFQVNRTAREARINPVSTPSSWRLKLEGASVPVEFAREELLEMDQYTESLPLACVEGWSTPQDWTGVRISDLAALAGIEGDSEVTVQSLEQGGSFNQATLAAGQVANERSLLALKVNGEDLSLDHGYPARVIVPALPGVHCTKWVSSMTFTQA
jgi:DMSO/TMAO reductase YedYZ molybdopterin-dependent catalytic subunit